VLEALAGLGRGLLAAEHTGQIVRTGDIGYLPQDPRTGDMDVLTRDRVFSARGLDDIIRRIR